MTRNRLIAAAIVAFLAASGSASAETVTIDIKTFQFSPKEVTVRVGDTIRWTNADGIEHSATADKAGTGFDTGLFEKGEQREITFTEAGEFSYHCERHPSMTGTVVVRGN